MDQHDENLGDIPRQGALSRALHSIRTRYSLATAFFVLLALAVFYTCGRIVLVHLMREPEQQVREIGYDISRLAYKQAEEVRRANAEYAGEIAKSVSEGAAPLDVLSRMSASGITLVLNLDAGGRFLAGAVRSVGASVVPLGAPDVAPYAERFQAWAASLDESKDAKTSVGIVQLGGAPHYVFMYPYPAGGQTGRVVVGAGFDSGVFSGRVGEGFVGLDVKIVNRRADIVVRPASGAASCLAAQRNDFGLVPMLSEAMNFYSGGFWDLGPSPFEAVFAVRDIAGNAVSMITVALPASLSTVTRSALGRLTFSIAVAGILMILPIFWFQSSVLLNPLTKMTKAIREIGERHQAESCPRLEWEGKDEFAVLAASVNRMLETVSERTVAIAQMEQRHKALIGALPDAVAVFDLQGRLVTISKEAEGVEPLPGFRTGEPPDPAVFGDPETDQFAKALAETVATGSVGQVRLKVQRPAGVPRSVPTRHFELRLTRMDEHFVLVIVRDVSAEVAEHKLRLEAEKRSLDSSKRESLTALAAGIAHDMKNVLSVVLSAAEAAEMGKGGEGLSQALGVVRDAVRRGVDMMRELTAFAGENRMTLMRAHPKLVVEDVRPLSSLLVGENIVLTIGADEAAPDVDVDPSQFWKVFFNIIKNAGEAIGTRPGHIDLMAMPFEMTHDEAGEFVSERPLREGQGVIFRIRDDGPGIPAPLLKRIFDPYVSSKSIGRGLGLATVRTIVEAHGGGIRVRSRVDAGTEFQIFLPSSTLPPNEGRKAESVEAAKQEPGDALAGDVLVVDDDEAILKTTSILLKALKLMPRAAHDRREALAVVRRYAHQLRAIMLDAHLGGIDTVRLLTAFKTGAPNVPVVVSSGSPEEEIRKMFSDHPYDAFLAKPYTLDELRRVLGRRNEAS